MSNRFTRMLSYAVTIYLALVLALLTGGCVTAVPQEPTSSPRPAGTDTPTPSPTWTPTTAPTATDTPAPTETATPTRTPTPNRQATREVRATQTAEAVILQIKADLEKLEISADTGYLGWYQQEPIIIDLNSFNEARYAELDENLKASDFILKTDITWRSSGGLAICGFFFRSEPNFKEGEQYLYQMIRLSGLPAWDITFREYGEFVANISDIRTSGAIDQDQMATNEIILVAEGEKFTMYINEERIGSFYDFSKRRLDGYFAFTASQESGASTCDFENSWIWMLK